MKLYLFFNLILGKEIIPQQQITGSLDQTFSPFLSYFPIFPLLSANCASSHTADERCCEQTKI